MLKKILFAFAITFSLVISAQTLIIDPAGDGGFETGATLGLNNWQTTTVPLPFFNQWVVNTDASGYSGARCAYITNNSAGSPPPYSYTFNQATVNDKIYRDVVIPTGEDIITLSFDWKGVGDADDFLKVWIVPSSTPLGLGALGPATGVTPADLNLIGTYNNETDWVTTTVILPTAYDNTTGWRLVFEWNSNGTAGSTPAAIDNISLTSEFVAVYCSPTSTYASDYIDDFFTSVGGSSDISNLNSGYTAPGYQDNTATQSVEQFAGEIVAFETVYGHDFTAYNLGFNVWVDWDKNGDFTDAGEKVYASGVTVAGGVDGDFLIPPATPLGDYRMRIRAQFANGNPSSCGNISYGEAEDYTLTVVDVNCTNDPSTIVVSAIDFTTATISWTAAAPAPGIGYEYFITTNTNTPLYNQLPTGTTTSATTTANLTSLSDGTTYYVWVRSVCDASFGGTGNWFGPEPFTTLVLPPTTTDISICPGDTGPNYLTATSAACANPANLGTQLNGTLDGTSPIAAQPDLPTLGSGSSATCAFKTQTSNYDALDFSVDVTGSYTFEMAAPSPDFDAMAYIVINDGTFTPGSCATGTWILGDDDSGPDLEPQLVVNLTAGVNYTLITTKWSSSFDTTHTGSYTWNIAGPGSLLGPIVGSMDWYTSPSGGTPIFSGVDFDPVGVAGSGLPDSNSTGIWSYWAACAGSPTVRTQADFIIGKVWTGAVDSDWNTPGNWSPSGIPDATDCVVVPNVANTPVISTGIDGVGNRLIVQTGGNLAQASNSSLTITDAVTVEAGGSYLIDDSASLVQINNVANTVNGTFQIARIATVRENDYIYWSSPVTSFNIQDVSPGTTSGYKYEWTPTVSTRLPGPGPDFNPNDYGEWQAADTGAMSPGKGYAIKAPTGHGATPAPLTAIFSGTPNNGSIAQTIGKGTFTGADYTYIPNGAASLTVTSDDDNWNFIGNPYPSALHLEDFLYHPAHSSFIDGTAYIWTHNTDIGANGQSFYEEFIYSYSGADYLAVNATGNSLPSPYKGFVASGQGFFVLMTDFSGNATENVYFENYMRSASNRNDQFYRSADASTEENTETKHRIWLDFIDASGNTNTTLIGYVNGATNEKDRIFDAKNTKGAGLNLYSMINDDPYLIQGRQLPFTDTDTVPLGINITEAGIQTIAINTLEGLFITTDQNIYIEDNVTGTTHNLNNAPYTFTSDIGIINDRFVLRYTPSGTLGINDFDVLSGIKVFKENDQLVVKSENETMQSIEVYDMLGRTLFYNTSINANRFTIGDISPNNATLVLKIKLVNGQQKIAKIIF